MAGPEKWVVNASPSICLGKLGYLGWLDRLAGRGMTLAEEERLANLVADRIAPRLLPNIDILACSSCAFIDGPLTAG